MIQNLIITLLKKGIFFSVPLLLVIGFLFVTDANDSLAPDTLTQYAETELTMQKLPPEFEESKQLLEKNNSSKTREQLYREIFGIPPPKPPRQIEASLTANDKVDGRIEVIFNENRTDFTIPAAPVISLITEMISSELLDAVKRRIDNMGRLSKSQLSGLRFETTFDIEQYLVHIEIPPDLLSKQVHDLKGYRDDPYVVESTKPNAFTAFTNVNLNEKLRYLQSSSNDSSNSYFKLLQKTNKKIRQPLTGNINGALSIKGVVLEGGLSFLENFNQPFQKKDVRLVYDLPKKMLRFTAGDLSYKTSGYLTYVSTGGLSFAKDYSLQPNLNSYPVSDREFFLNERSEVDVWVNDILVRSMELEPGTHDIRGFPFAAGSNNVKIVIKDFSGRSETLEFNHIYETTLLAKGKSQYMCNIGVPSKLSKNTYVYDIHAPCLMVDYKRGLTDRLTLDVYVQSLLDRVIFGSGETYAFSLGNIHLDIAGSYVQSEGVDCAARLGLLYRSRVSYVKSKKTETSQVQRVNPLTWNTDVEYIGPRFPKQLQDSLLYYENGVRFSTELGIPMQGQFNLGVRSTFTLRPDSENVFAINVGVQKEVFKSLRASASLGYTSDTKTKQANPYISVSAQWTFLSGPNSFSINETVIRSSPSTIDTSVITSKKNNQWDFGTDVQWDYLSLNPRPEKMVAGITARVDDKYSEYNGRLGYNGNVGSIEFNQNLATPGYFQEQLIQHQSDLTLKTSLVFVDGVFGLSRPVYNGFVIAKGVKNLKGSTIRINPNDDGYDATSVWRNPAVLTLPSAYQLQKVKLSPLNSSVSSVNEKMTFTLFPQYTSGFLLNVGTDITVLVVGTLLAYDRTPLKYQSITITLKSDEVTEPINTFTNQAGKFQFMGKAGRTYEILFGGTQRNEKPVLITIPEDKNDYFRAGEIITSVVGMPENSTENTVTTDTINTPLPKTVNADTVPAVDTTLQPAPSSSPTISAEDSLRQEKLKQMVDTKVEKVIDSAEANTAIDWDQSSDTLDDKNVVIDSADVINDSLAKHLVDPRGRKTYILGTLRNPEGNPLPFTMFEITPIDDSSSKPVRSFTDKFGNFQIIGTKPSRYRISTILPMDNDKFVGMGSFSVGSKDMGSYHQTGKMNLKKTQQVPLVDLTNDSTIRVTGTLVDKDGEPIRFTPISFMSLDNVVNMVTGRDGSFQALCTTPGMYMIYITGSKNSTGTFVNIKPGTKGIFNVGTQMITP